MGRSERDGGHQEPSRVGAWTIPTPFWARRSGRPQGWEEALDEFRRLGPRWWRHNLLRTFRGGRSTPSPWGHPDSRPLGSWSGTPPGTIPGRRLEAGSRGGLGRTTDKPRPYARIRRRPAPAGWPRTAGDELQGPTTGTTPLTSWVVGVEGRVNPTLLELTSKAPGGGATCVRIPVGSPAAPRAPTRLAGRDH